MTIPAATSDSNYDAATDDPKQARAQLSALQQAYEQTRSFQGGEMGSLTATDAGTLDVDSVDAGTIYVAAQAGSPSPVIDDLGTPTRGAPWKTLIFEAGITIQHAAGTLELPGAADIVTEDGDSAVVAYDTVGSPAFWRVISYQRAAQAPIAPGISFIASADASNDATLDFTFTDTDFDAVVFVLQNVVPASDGDALRLRTSTDGGSTWDATAGDYRHVSQASRAGTTAYTQDGVTSDDDYVLMRIYSAGSAAGEDGASGTVTVYGPSLAKQTFMKSELAYTNDAGDFAHCLGVGRRNASENVNGVRFFFGAGNIESGTITAYGLRNA